MLVGPTPCKDQTGDGSVNYTHYDYLELAPGASRARIEAAYAAVLERFQYGAVDAGQDLSGLVRRIHAAYETLSDSDRRRSYDAQLADEAARADEELKSILDDQSAVVQRRVQDVPETLRAMLTPLAA
jgi:DnaJ-class molecular chaperone